MLAEAGAVCLEKMNHGSGVVLTVNGSVQDQFTVWWDTVTDQQLRTYFDLPEATEWGACSIAILLAIHLTEFTVIERSRKGTGFDYWLGYQNEPGPPFQNAARLEISGILDGSDANIRSRVGQKSDQVKQSANTGLPVYIIIVEFSAPISYFVEQS